MICLARDATLDQHEPIGVIGPIERQDGHVADGEQHHGHGVHVDYTLDLGPGTPDLAAFPAVLERGQLPGQAAPAAG